MSAGRAQAASIADCGTHRRPWSPRWTVCRRRAVALVRVCGGVVPRIAGAPWGSFACCAVVGGLRWMRRPHGAHRQAGVAGARAGLS